MESAGDPEEQPFIAAAPAPPGGPRSRAIRVGCGTAAAALVLALMAVVANSTQARGVKAVSGKGESVLSAEGHVADAGLGAEPMQNAVGLDVSFGGDNNGVFVGGDNTGTVNAAGRDVAKIQMKDCECGGNGGPGGEVGCCCKNCCAAAAQSSEPCQGEACADGAWKRAVEQVTSSAECQPRLLGDFDKGGLV